MEKYLYLSKFEKIKQKVINQFKTQNDGIQSLSLAISKNNKKIASLKVAVQVAYVLFIAGLILLFIYN